MSRKSNRIGQTHGVFKVVSFYGTASGESLWECLCTSCGNTVTRKNRYFRKDRPAPVGCPLCKGENHWLYKGYKELCGTYLSRIKKQAQERGYVFEVTPDHLWSLFLKQNKRCYLTNIKLTLGHNQTASLDRLDSSCGYVIGNLAWCHKDINKMKGSYDLAYFIEMCKKVNKQPNVPELVQ